MNVGSIAESCRIGFFAACCGDGLENAGLQRSKLFYEESKVFALPVKDKAKRFRYIFWLQRIPCGCRQPERFAEFLCVSRIPVGCGVYGVERFLGEGAAFGRESLTYELEEFAFVYFPDRKSCGGVVERTFGAPEHVCHPVSNASEKYVGRIGIELDATAHDGEGAFSIFDVKEILEFVENDADFSLGRLSENGIENGVERGRFAGNPRVERYCRRAGILIYGHDRSEMRKKAERLGKPSVRAFKFRESGDEPFAKIGKVSDGKEIGVKESDALHVANSLKNERSLACPPFALNDDVLPRLDVGSELLFEVWPWTEKVSFDGASVFEWIHCSLFSSVLYLYVVLPILTLPLSVVPLGIMPFGTTLRMISFLAAGRKGKFRWNIPTFIKSAGRL